MKINQAMYGISRLLLPLIGLLLPLSCVTEPDDRKGVEAWAEVIPDTAAALPPAEWIGVTFYARQHPPDTTYYILEWVYKGPTQFRIEVGHALPGVTATSSSWYVQRDSEMFLMWVAWGKHGADTAYYVH
jgi:hypothetical protein